MRKFQSLFSWTLLQQKQYRHKAWRDRSFNPYFPGLSCNWTHCDLPCTLYEKSSFNPYFPGLSCNCDLPCTLYEKSSFNPYFPGLSCNCDLPCTLYEASKVSILIFLDSPATLMQSVESTSVFWFQSLFSWTLLQPKGRQKAIEGYDVSILVFLDSPATRDMWCKSLKRWKESFNPCFPGLSCNPLKILFHSHFHVCSHPIYIFRYGSWRKIFKDMTLKYTHGRRDGEDGAGNNDERST